MPKFILKLFFSFFLTYFFLGLGLEPRAYSQTTPPKPYTQYTLDDNTGSQVVLDSANGNNALASFNTSTMSVAGKIDRGFTFNGSTQYVDLANIFDFIRNDKEGTFSLWVKPTNSFPILSFTGPGGYFSFEWYKSNQSLTFYIAGDGNPISCTTARGTMPPNVFTHIAVTQDGSQFKIFINGVEQTDLTYWSNTNPGAWLSFLTGSITSGRLGAVVDGENQYFLNGVIDDVQYFKRALTADEVMAIYEPVISPVEVPTVTLTSSAASVAYGGTVRLNWSSTNATSCTTPGGSTATNGSYTTPSLTANKTYTVSCTGPGGSKDASVSISVGASPSPAPTVTLTASPTSIAYNGTSNLTWSSTNATSCTTPGGSTATSGTYRTPALTATKTYTVSCTGTGGMKSDSVTVNVASPIVPVNGVCGSAHGGNFTSIPVTGLCSVGTASSVSGSGPWTWSCSGISGGASVSCSANKIATGSNPWTFANYASQWKLVNPAGGSATQLDAGVRLTAPASGDIYLLSKTPLNPTDGFQMDFDYLIISTPALSGSGTWTNIGLVRGDGSAGFPFEVSDWNSNIPDETNLRAHATGFRATFANKNAGVSSIQNEYRVRIYPDYTQFAPSDGGYGGDSKITLNPGIPYHVTFKLSGNTLSLKVTSSSGVQQGSYTSPSFNLSTPQTIFLKHAGGRNAEIKNFVVSTTSLEPACGSADGQSFTAIPRTDLCSPGTPSIVSGTGPWTWTCAGPTGTTPASCRAEKRSDIGGVDVSRKWMVRVQPDMPFLDPRSYGSASAVPVLGGVLNSGSLQTEMPFQYGAANTQGVRVFTPKERPAGLTDTSLTVNGVEVIKRVPDPDPDHPGQWAFKFTLNKIKTGWTNDSQKVRAEVNHGGPAQWTKWGDEAWGVSAVWFGPEWKLIDGVNGSGSGDKAESAIFYQYHSPESSLGKNPPFAVTFLGGNGDPTRSRITVIVRRWDPDLNRWTGDLSSTVTIPNPEPNTWHYFVTHYRTGTGVAGSTGTQPPFFHVYHAVGNGPLKLILKHDAPWNYPNAPRTESTTWCNNSKSGIYYYKPTIWSAPLSAERVIYTKGFATFRKQDVPTATADDFLNWIREGKD